MPIWYEVSEDLPPDDGHLRWCYSAVHQLYWAALWTPARGWVDDTNNPLKIITHWSDMILYRPFPQIEYDEVLAKKYGLIRDN